MRLSLTPFLVTLLVSATAGAFPYGKLGLTNTLKPALELKRWCCRTTSGGPPATSGTGCTGVGLLTVCGPGTYALECSGGYTTVGDPAGGPVSVTCS